MSETDTLQMFEFFLIVNTYVMFGGHVFQQTFLWAETVRLFSLTFSFIGMRQTSYLGLLNKRAKKLAQSFNFTFCDIDDVLPFNNIYN